jgi:hypothetical protein
VLVSIVIENEVAPPAQIVWLTGDAVTFVCVTTVTVVVVAVERHEPLFTVSVYVPATAGLTVGFCNVDV